MNMRTPTTNNIIAGSTDRQARAVSEKVSKVQFMLLYVQMFRILQGLEQNSRNKAYLGHSLWHLPACFIMRAYTPIDTITREIN